MHWSYISRPQPVFILSLIWASARTIHNKSSHLSSSRNASISWDNGDPLRWNKVTKVNGLELYGDLGQPQGALTLLYLRLPSKLVWAAEGGFINCLILNGEPRRTTVDPKMDLKSSHSSRLKQLQSLNKTMNLFLFWEGEWSSHKLIRHNRVRGTLRNTSNGPQGQLVHCGASNLSGNLWRQGIKR